MATEPKPLHNFNTETMSGIYPGSSTMIYQRLRLHHEAEQGKWRQLQWYSEPNAAILLPIALDEPAIIPIFTLAEPQQGDFSKRLHGELTQAGLFADACFACRHWQPADVQTEDGLPAGKCRWDDATAALPDVIAIQSALSLSCEHMQRLDRPLAVTPDPANQNSVHPQAPNSAELDPDRLPFWPRLWHNLRRRNQPRQDWTDQIIERSGVGAGTEPCFLCQGRLANLGALAVASPEGDKQTFSVWRCRSCYTTYLNDWTDRWERLESLETEESYFRVAPAEAYAALRIIHATVGGEHPGRRKDRTQEHAQMLALIAGKQPLSHQIRQGR